MGIDAVESILRGRVWVQNSVWEVIPYPEVK